MRENSGRQVVIKSMRRITMFYPDEKKANPGDVIEFVMEQQLLKGEVLPSNCVNSIIVDISELNDTSELEHSYPNTVVAHKKYRVIEEV